MSEAKDAVKSPGRFDRRDFVGLLGLVLIGVGLGLVWLPAALIVPGAILSGVAIFGVKS